MVERALADGLPGWDGHRARLQLAYGRWLRRQRRITDARTMLRAARDLADSLTLTTLARAARQELRATGEAGDKPVATALAELTPQELQIARLVTQGLTNREIGQRLYLSHRTVGSHLYRIFPKLGITSCAQLARLLEPDASS